ncbi:MAG: lipopolysaccharide biosynthesis protein [Bacteroidaceae bacterium]|nr:lipopolysaccharide biosynthesis protein [Bacteroidaceae bacterium]
MKKISPSQTHSTLPLEEERGGGLSLKRRTAQGLIWGGFSNGIVQLLGALFGLWLINILDPDDYGKMAALVIFSNIASVLQESGFTAALANKSEPTHEEYNAVFWFNVIVGLVLYVLLFFAAPLIADFYNEPVLCPLGRFAFLGFVFSCFGTAQRAYLFGHLMVKQTSIMQMASITLSGIVGVCLAYAGFAYWGLAAQSLVYVASVTAFAWAFSPWRPSLPAVQKEVKSERMKSEKYKLQGLSMSKSKAYFSLFILSLFTLLRPAWQMFGFSSKLLINSLAFQLNNNAFGVLLNRFYPGGHLAGIYSNARKWDDMAIATIGGMVQGVAQPVLRESSRQTPSRPTPDPSREEGEPSGLNEEYSAQPLPSLTGSEGNIGLTKCQAVLSDRSSARPKGTLDTSRTPLLRTGKVGGGSAEGGPAVVFRKLLRFTCFVSFPCLLGLALIAEDFIVLLAGEKWHDSALLLSMLCVYGAFSPVVTLYSNLVISRGRSTINMVIGLLNCAFVWGGIIVLHALGYGLHEMVIFYVALNIAWLFVWQACARRLIGLRWWHALKDIAPFFVFALAVMAVAYFATQSLPISWLRMCLRIVIAVVLYVGSLWIARAQILRESIAYIFKKK